MTTTHTADGRPRARGLGIALPGQPGPLNAITDVGGIEVGVTTLISGDGPLVVGKGPVRTGVTAILPRGRAGVGQPCAARLVLAQRQRRDDRHHMDRRGRIVQSADRAVEYACGRRLPHRASSAGSTASTRCSRGNGCCRCARRRGTATSTTSTAVTSAPSTSKSALDAAATGPGRGGIGRRRNRHELLRLQGRQRHRVPIGQLRPAHLHRRRLRSGQLRLARRIDRCRKACRAAAGRRQPARQRLVRGRPRAQAARRRRLGHRHRRHRRSPAARPVQGAGATGSVGPGPHRNHGQPLLRRHLPCLLHRRRARAGQHVSRRPGRRRTSSAR